MERVLGMNYVDQYYTTFPGGVPRHIARTIDDSPSAAKYHSLACMWYDMLKPDITEPFIVRVQARQFPSIALYVFILTCNFCWANAQPISMIFCFMCNFLRITPPGVLLVIHKFYLLILCQVPPALYFISLAPVGRRAIHFVPLSSGGEGECVSPGVRGPTFQFFCL